MNWRLLCVTAGLALTTAACSTPGAEADPPAGHEAAAAEHSWTYADVEDWGETCASGRQQSPVDLTGATPEDLVDVAFDYHPSAVTVVNNGHTIQAVYGPGSSIEVDGADYDLVQFHVHAPSEHSIEGELADAELHLVHQDADGNLAVVGVLIEEGAASAAIEPVLADVPAEEGDETTPADRVDAGALLPGPRTTYRYDGSLTTPPCSEGVTWIVMTEPVTWSAGQLAAFTELYAGTNRPLQPLGDRTEVEDIT